MNNQIEFLNKQLIYKDKRIKELELEILKLQNNIEQLKIEKELTIKRNIEKCENEIKLYDMKKKINIIYY